MEKIAKFISDDRLTMINEVGINIVRGLDFEKLLLRSNHSDYIHYLKYKLNKYPFNELKINIKNMIFLDSSFNSKSHVVRLEIAVRDQDGASYQRFYKTMSDTDFQFEHTFESLIYQHHPQEIRINETFFLRIPTKTIENFK